MSWHPQRYLAYEGERLRPALDLLARVPIEAPRTVVDLGCGAGNVTRVLAERWPGAAIVGVDSSEAMLAKARAATAEFADVRYETADIDAWTPPAPVDLVYSNAALHWLPDHATLYPHLFAQVAPGGALATQIPVFHAMPVARMAMPKLLRSADVNSSSRNTVRKFSHVHSSGQKPGVLERNVSGLLNARDTIQSSGNSAHARIRRPQKVHQFDVRPPLVLTSHLAPGRDRS